MVKIDVSGISKKLKIKRTEKLLKESFDNSFKITWSGLGQISVKKIGSIEDFFLIIELNKNEFHLGNRNYFNTTKEIAEKYEVMFAVEPTIKMRYF
jgi:hypothetical protein